MKPRIVVPLLAAATLAIGIENWLYFSRDAAPIAAAASDAEESFAEDGGLEADSRGAHEARAAPPPLLGAAALAALLASFDALRSPFLPAGGEISEDLGLPSFGGLLIGTERRIAWLGDHARSEGELYEGWTVARVEESRVVLERGGRRYSLWLDAPRAEGAGDPDPDPALASEEEKLP